jgi:hypothetical protein
MQECPLLRPVDRWVRQPLARPRPHLLKPRPQRARRLTLRKQLQEALNKDEAPFCYVQGAPQMQQDPGLGVSGGMGQGVSSGGERIRLERWPRGTTRRRLGRHLAASRPKSGQLTG